MSDTMNLFKAMIVVQLFYAVSITMLSYGIQSIPSLAQDYTPMFDDIADRINMKTIADDVEGGLTNSINVPLIELGALVFYSGNILIDLLLNFLFAIPEMLAMLINGLTMLFNIPSIYWQTIQLFAMVIISVMYFLGLIGLLANLRSGAKSLT